MFTNLESVDATSTGAKYIKAGIHTVKVTKVESSKATNPNARTPYIDFHMEAGDGSIGKARIFGDREGQSPEAAEYKAKMLKRLLMACGVTDFKDYIKACKETVGSTVTVAFAEREYWTNDDNDMPVIRKAIDYKWPVKDGEQFDPSWNKSMSQEDLRAYNDALEAAGTATTSVVDDMPF